MWALGVMLIVMMKGALPFRAPTQEVCERIGSYIIGLPEEVKQYLAKLLVPDPTARASMNQVLYFRRDVSWKDFLGR